MKNNFSVAYMVAVMLIIFAGCSEDEVLIPDEQARPSAVEPEEDKASSIARRKSGKYISTPITGTIEGVAFSAEYRITQFVNENGTLYAIGTLNNITGNGLPANVSDLQMPQIQIPVELPAPVTAQEVTIAQAPSCDILFLQLGPLDLDLLGLQVHLDQVTLEINAQTGSGNLLGNLLCAITGLLDGVAALAAIAQLLNQIIGLIGTLP